MRKATSGGPRCSQFCTIPLDIHRVRMTRDQSTQAVKAENTGTGIHFTALHLHGYYRETHGYRPADFPSAEWVSDRTMSLPLSPKLAEGDVVDVVEAVSRVISYHRR